MTGRGDARRCRRRRGDARVRVASRACASSSAGPTSPGTPTASTCRRATAGFAVTFLGVASLLLDDGESAVMTDGFFSRPSLVEGRARQGRARPRPHRRGAGPGRGRPARRRCCRCTPTSTTRWTPPSSRSGPAPCSSAASRRRTSDAAHGLPEDRIRVVTPGEPMTYGAFTLTLIESHHCPPDRFPGRDHRAGRPAGRRPRRTSAARPGRSWSSTPAARPRCSRAAPASSPGRWPGGAPTSPTSASASSACRARTTSAPTGPRPSRRSAPGGSCSSTGTTSSARSTEPLRALPYLGDDLDVTMRVRSTSSHARGCHRPLPDRVATGGPVAFAPQVTWRVIGMGPAGVGTSW